MAVVIAPWRSRSMTAPYAIPNLSACKMKGRKNIHKGRWGVAGILFLFVCACAGSLPLSDEPIEPVARNRIIKKTYANAPLSRFELGRLIEMISYNGKPEYYGDIILDRRVKKYGSKPVVFSHQTHRRHFTCEVCHTELEFSLSKGQTDITREDYLEGRYCGACHNGTIAFSTEFACDACHQDISSNERTYPPHKALEGAISLPQTTYGDRINWVEAIEQDLVRPQRSLPGEDMMPGMPLPRHLEQSMYWTTALPSVIVRFPHAEHMKWLDCSNCHPDLFSIKQAGTIAFDKESNLYGQFCGACHMNVAFPMNGCSRCHPRIKDYRRKARAN
nr:c(7)-type cytochrome triheme domain-containing protein [uncultured Desulfuromusa sp.]